LYSTPLINQEGIIAIAIAIAIAIEQLAYRMHLTQVHAIPLSSWRDSLLVTVTIGMLVFFFHEIRCHSFLLFRWR
jgi:hypothetical protein